MKRVVIVRHAKSVPYGYDDDFNRDLTERGINDAEKLSLKLRALGVFPELVIASPATRTMHTAAIYCQNLGYEINSIQQEQDLYDGITTHDFIELLHQLSEEVQTVFVFGHNPTVHTLAYNLVHEFYSDMPTCATVALDFQFEKWKFIAARSGEVAFQLLPKSV
jgi:phosphohistidine phosphatase